MLHSPLIEQLLHPLATSPDPNGQFAAIFSAMMDAWSDLQSALDAVGTASNADELSRGYALRSRAVSDIIVSLQATNYALQRQAQDSMHTFAFAVAPDEMLTSNALNELNLNRSQHA